MGSFPGSPLHPAGLTKTGRPLASQRGWEGATRAWGPPAAHSKLALSPARTYALRAAAGGPVTWRTVGRKLAAGGRVVAGATGDHTE